MKDEPVILRSLNARVLGIFAPLLIVVGVLGFLLPRGLSLTSGAAPYNLFHIAFGTLGVLLVLSGREAVIRGFNLFFGLIDLYQALASFLHLFPERYFLWMRADDVLHVLIGGGLVAVSLWRPRC